MGAGFRASRAALPLARTTAPTPKTIDSTLEKKDTTPMLLRLPRWETPAPHQSQMFFFHSTSILIRKHGLLFNKREFNKCRSSNFTSRFSARLVSFSGAVDPPIYSLLCIVGRSRHRTIGFRRIPLVRVVAVDVSSQGYIAQALETGRFCVSYQFTAVTVTNTGTSGPPRHS